MNTTIKMLLLAISLVLLIACGNSVDRDYNSIKSETEKTIDKIIEYIHTKDKTKSPTIEDYKKVGIKGIDTKEKLQKINTTISKLKKEDVDTKEKIQKIADSLDIVIPNPQPNQNPIANAGEDKNIKVGETITLIGIAKDNDGTIQSYSWSEKTKILAKAKILEYTPTTVGTHILTLTVIDNKGVAGSDSVVVVVNKDKLDPDKFLDVSTFGTKADGITDDTQAIRNAIEQLSDGGTLYFPKGEYLINSGTIANPEDVGILIKDKSNIKILGESETNTKIIDAFDGYKYEKVFNGLGTIMVINSKNISLSHLSFQSKSGFPKNFKNKSYDGHHSGVSFQGVDTYYIHHIRASHYNQSGLIISSWKKYISKNGRIRINNLSYNRVAGLLLSTSEDTTIEENTFTYNGLPGDGGTGYGMAGSDGIAGFAGSPPVRVLVRNNLAAYNVRKGIDFHAGYDLKIINNISKGNGLYGINVEGGIDSNGISTLGGTIEIVGNTISDMNPTTAQNVHDLDSKKYLMDRNRPNMLEGGTDYWNSVKGIFVYFPSSLEKRPQVIIKDNTIKDFTGENPPNSIDQSYYPIFIYSNASNPNVDYTIEDNVVNCGKIKNFFTTRYSSTDSSIEISNNIFNYKNVTDPELILESTSIVKVTNNLFKRIGSMDTHNYWNDAMVKYTTNEAIISDNRWFK